MEKTLKEKIKRTNIKVNQLLVSLITQRERERERQRRRGEERKNTVNNEKWKLL